MSDKNISLEKLRINPDWAKLPLFDRTGWKRLPFGAFAESVNERVEPSDAAEEIYVGLDDLDPQNLHIRRWGKGSDVIGTKLRFRKGDIIFGRRRAYQRKLAVADFDGICSAHAMVVRAKPEFVLPEFLPFLMMSDRFMNRAVEISVGSLSPTINWKTLKLEEFDLPPLDQQRCIAEIFLATDAVVESWFELDTENRSATGIYALDAFHGVSVTEGCTSCACCRLGDVFEVRTGSTPSRAQPEYWGGDIPWIKTGEINYEDIYESEETISPLGFENSAVRMMPPDSVLMALYGQGPTLGRVAQLRVEAAVNQACAAIFPKPRFEMRYLYYYLAHQYSNIRKLARGASQPNINALIVKDFVVPAPTLDEQGRVVDAFETFHRTQASIDAHIEGSRSLLQELANGLTV